MAADGTAYLVVRHEAGFGDVFPLTPPERYTMGRGNTNRIVLKDDLCSRRHAEVFFTEGYWHIKDSSSLNGTHVNGLRLEAEGPFPVVDNEHKTVRQTAVEFSSVTASLLPHETQPGPLKLSPGDEIQLGKTRLLFVQEMAELPALQEHQPDEKAITIKKRVGLTRFLTPIPPNDAPTDKATGDKAAQPATDVADGRSFLRELALLYRLALDMGSANTYADLVRIVLDGLLEAIPAEVGAILSVKEGPNLEVTANRHRDPSIRSYTPVSEFVTNEVLATREAILAEDVARDRYLRSRDSLTHMGATSLICAPVTFADKVLALIHLYCTNPHTPLTAEDLEFTVAVARHLGAAAYQINRQAALTNENRSLRDQLRVESELVGTSGPMKAIESQIGRVAATNATVLIRGESGSGKELVARAIHYSSLRKDGPFVCLNCAALSESLLESELFGHEKGAFSGATKKKIGKFEAADHGTIFLDEIGEMNSGTQAKLLRILEGHPFDRVGGHTPIRVDVRVVAATNQPLEQAIQRGAFRRDLFFRLQVIEIPVPPLRERLADVPLLADHFLKRFIRETGRKIGGFTPSALRKMETYHWPGNVRELRNVIERAVVLGTAQVIDAPDIWLSWLQARPSTQSFDRPGNDSQRQEAQELVAELLAHGPRKRNECIQAGTDRGISESTMQRAARQLGVKSVKVSDDKGTYYQWTLPKS